jgi:hypothetical protein
MIAIAAIFVVGLTPIQFEKASSKKISARTRSPSGRSASKGQRPCLNEGCAVNGGKPSAPRTPPVLCISHWNVAAPASNIIIV